MLQRLGPLLIAATLLTAPLLATGCSAEPIPESEKILIESSSSPLGPAAKDGKAKEKKNARSKKKAWVVTAQGAGIRFTAPSGWQPIADGVLDFSVDSPRGREIAEGIGVSAEQLRAMMDGVDAFLVGFAGVLTVGALDSSGVLPSAAAYEAGFGSIDATFEPAEERGTPLGAGRVYSYEIRVGNTVQRGTTLYVLNGSTVVEITAAGPDAVTARAVLDQVISTIKRS